jgi:NAD(P)-dependent dehydrogenase (short-subunit alcohol dehydrogenase family)
MFSVQDKNIIITGAARGLGAALARHFAAQGCKVALLDVRDQSEIAAATGGLAITCDVREADQVMLALDQIEDELGPIHGHINNAGVYNTDDTREDFNRVFETNVWGMALCSNKVGARMARGGSIVSIGSHICEHHASTEDLMMYVASKAAMLNINRCLSIALGAKGIRCNVVAPSVIALPGGYYGPELLKAFDYISPLGIATDATEVCAAVHYYLADVSAHVSGVHHIMDGGFVQGYSLNAFEAVLGPKSPLSAR